MTSKEGIVESGVGTAQGLVRTKTWLDGSGQLDQ